MTSHKKQRPLAMLLRHGGLTPWEKARVARAERRAKDPEVQARAQKHARVAS